MFGYIRPFKPELKIFEYDHYKAFYCGLCKTIKSNFGFLPTLGLNYDFAFLSLLYSSLYDTNLSLNKDKCVVNPFKKTNFIISNGTDFATYVFILSVYYKLDDDKKDNGIKDKAFAYISQPFIKKYYKRSCIIHNRIDTALKKFTLKQIKLEKRKESNIDIASDPTAHCFGQIFREMAQNSKDALILERLGYFIGRWIYLIDAFDDLDKDIKNNNYNPYIYKYKTKNCNKIIFNKVYNDIEIILNLTIGEIINCYNLLDIKNNKNILDNIMFLGFKNTQIFIKNNKEIKNNVYI
ncbi:MAG: DUF5685 family protein [Oscillospiraceae bacterium]